MLKRMLCLLMTLFLLAAPLPLLEQSAGASEVADPVEETDPILTVELDETAVCLLYGGEGRQLQATVYPETPGAGIYWMSDNEAVATVDDNGVITPHSVGMATITAQACYLQKAVCTVTVTDNPVTSLSMSETELTMEDRTAYVLETAVGPATADNLNVTWSSSDKSVAVVNQNGKVFAKSPGSCWISATANGGVNVIARCKLTVEPSDKPMKYVALTFDDGPCNNTLDILDILAEYDVHATFFCLGRLVDTYPDYVRKAYAAGHEIANHSYSHETLTKIGKDDAKDQMDRADEAIKKAIGIEASVYRAPGGSVNEKIAQYCGKPFIDWTVDTNDWKYRDPEHVWTFIAKNTVNYDIVLMHDIRPTTMEAMHKAIPYLLEQGFTLITVSELLDILDWNDPSMIYEP